MLDGCQSAGTNRQTALAMVCLTDIWMFTTGRSRQAGVQFEIFIAIGLYWHVLMRRDGHLLAAETQSFFSPEAYCS